MKLWPIAVFVLGCSGGSNASSPGATPADGSQCAHRSGTYVTDYVTRSGDCGKIPEQVDTVTSQPTSVDAPCTGTVSYTADNCKVTASATCPVTSKAISKLRQDGTYDWSPDGSHATGIVQYTGIAADGTAACSGTYDVTVTKH